MKQAEKNRQNILSLVNVVECYISYFQAELGFGHDRKRKPKRHKGHHPFIPTHNPVKTLNYLRRARDYIRKRDGIRYTANFLDCGCGIGNIMLLAHAVGFDNVGGVEYDDKTCKFAKQLLGRRGKVFKEDLIEFKNYAYYNVIYYFEPMHCEQKRAIFMKKLVNDTKVGTILITNGNSAVFRDSRKFKMVNPGQYGIPMYEKMRI